MKHFFLIFILIFFANTQAQVYSGKIDNYEIFLYLDHPLDEYRSIYNVTYFYKTQLKNIWLSGKMSKDSVILYTQYAEPSDAEELFSLQKQGDNLIGTWINKDKQLKVSLYPSQVNASAFKSDKFELQRDSISSFNNQQLVWFTEKYSKASLFRLGNGFSKEQRLLFNTFLDKIHFENAETILDCQYVELYNNLTFISEKYISFIEHAEIDCGGAHPNHGLNTYNFDLKNIKVIDKLNEVYPDIDFVKLLAEKYGKDNNLMEESEYFSGSNDCWEYANWVFVKDGIEITPYFPHVLTPCRDAFPISFEEIERFQNTQK